MWANENWTRRWDGSDQDVLMAQDYHKADEPALLADWARHFADPRYIRLAGRPVLMVYRAGLVPDTAATLARWRRTMRDGHGEDPVFVMAQSFGEEDPRPFGMDAAVEFPPHKLTGRVPLINDTLHLLDPEFEAEVYEYGAVADASEGEPAPAYPLIKTAVPGWDNEPRRPGCGTVLHGATPARYQAWLEALIRHARRNKVLGEAVVCVNAWNEWAEGAVLEPDVHWGGAFLNATARAVAGLPARAARPRLLLVGHDALRHGSQQLLLRIGRTLQAAHGAEVSFLLLEGGPMEAEYRALGPVTVARDKAALAAAARAARQDGCVAALVNSAASAGAVPALVEAGLRAVQLVHELPRLLHERGLLDALRPATQLATVVFPAEAVRDQCLEALGVAPETMALVPQGIAPQEARAERAATRAALHAADGTVVALGLGYADLRKGFDLFLQAWRSARAAGERVMFAWAGAMDPAAQAYLGPEIAAAEATGSFRYLGHREDTADLLAAADVFLLPSREDPLPSAALEAMASGLPVVAFGGTGGIPDLIARFGAGRAVSLGDAAGMAAAAMALARGQDPAARAALAVRCAAAFRMELYTERLLRLARPDLPSVSVVVPGCDYARFMERRLASVFRQSLPVAEVVVLDDASEDDSVAVARRTAQDWGRTIRLERRDVRSGSVFAQWRRAAETASGEWLWIAEADDEAEHGFLEAVARAAAATPGAVLAFSDSAAVDAEGAVLWPDHKAYYGPAVLAEDAVFDGAAFLRSHLGERNLLLNASAVLWRRSALLAALARCSADLRRLQVAGDWRLYAEVLSQPGALVCYVAQPLNRHRRHAASVTARQSAPAQIAEIRHVQAAIARMVGPDAALRQRQRAYRHSLNIRRVTAGP